MSFFKPNIQKMLERQDLPRLTALLADQRDDVREAAMQALISMSLSAPDAEIRSKAFDEICMVVFPDRPGRGSILFALRDITKKTDDAAYLSRIRSTLITVLEHDNDSWIRGAAAKALSQFGEAAVEALGDALLRAMAQVMLTQFSPVRYNFDERIPIVEALGETHDYRAVAPIIATISMQEKQPMFMLPATMKSRYTEVATEALGKLGTSAVEELGGVLKFGSHAELESVFTALGMIGGQEATAVLVKAIEVEDRWILVHAAVELAKLGDPRALEPLINTLKEDNSVLQWIAARGLGDLGDPVAIESLNAVLKGEDIHLRELAAEAIGKIKSKAGLAAVY